ncbi:TfoX/Sxy family protein [Aestuariibacter halophilus]|uniref:TfoX/Sxy family protein n=1 Tax=Fluctibacter halophilus TaxID=226011 RepID=A0ABS8G8F0_9ALTE|nr:TfoX/Sxy family DNA transformation protein [Aestuariibacter halophilus]MCC2616808.1 TfoX/Sxy family protein [Aestuariibacter halophilus]
MSEVTRVRQLAGLGPRSEALLAMVGVHSVEAFMVADPFALYRQLAEAGYTNLNLLYAMIGAQQGCHWQTVARQQRTQILLRLDDMGLAP